MLLQGPYAIKCAGLHVGCKSLSVSPVFSSLRVFHAGQNRSLSKAAFFHEHDAL